MQGDTWRLQRWNQSNASVIVFFQGQDETKKRRLD